MRLHSIPLGFVLLTMACVARAQGAPAMPPPPAARALGVEVAAPAGWRQVGAAALDGMRGGFTTPSGLALSLGIERSVSINGEVVAHTNFRIADVGNISGDEARQAQAALGTAWLVQNGARNFAAGGAVGAGRGTFVQNSLNGQTINTQTTISSNVNSMSLLKDMNFQGGLRDAAIRAIGTK